MEGKAIKLIIFVTTILQAFNAIVTFSAFWVGIATGNWIFFIIGAIAIVAVITVFCLKARISYAILKFIMNLTCPDKMYKTKEKHVIYEFKSRTSMRHEKCFKVEALHDGFSGVIDKFKWTGDTELIPKAKERSQTIELMDQPFGMQRYKIKFKHNRTYNRREDIEDMSMVIDNIQDPNKKSSLHLSSGVFEITDCLKLHVIFNKDLKPTHIRKLEYLHYSDDEHYKCENVTYENNDKTDTKEVIWEIKKPIYGGKYIIDWTFEED